MTNKLLYFPHIDIPRSDWTTKSILYWDEVGIIVPPNYIENPNRYNKFTVELLQTDLVRAIFPYEFVSRVNNFDRAFIELVRHEKFGLEKRKADYLVGLSSKIHVQKVGEELLNYLVDQKIAKRLDWEWYHVESRTANLIMLYLASAIGKVGGFTPATDSIDNLDASISKNGLGLRTSIRQGLLDDLMPYPIEANPTQLRRFKDKFHDELTSFRILLEKTVLDLSTIVSQKDRKSRQTLVVEEIEDKKAKILSELTASRLGQISMGTVCGIAGAVIGFSQGNQPLGAFSLANALYSAFQGYDKSGILEKDYSYLALVERGLKKRN